MNKLGASFTGIRNSAFLTLYGRWRDSLDRHPILNDSWAAGVVNRLDFDFSQLTRFNYTRFTIAARSRLLDDWVRRFLSDNPGAVALDAGCGLDSRVFRVDPAAEHPWYDVDFPDLIELRDRLYPQRPEHTSIGADIADESWLGRIPDGRPAIVVADSLFMFLPEDVLQQFLRRVIDHFRHGELVFTAYSSLVKRWETRKCGGDFFRSSDIAMKWTYDGPADIARLDSRLRPAERHSQTELRLHRNAPLYDRLMCAFVNINPATRYSATALRYQF